MEIKMNKDIRNYTESMFFGLSLRQFFFSALGCLVSVILFFIPLMMVIGLVGSLGMILFLVHV